MMIGVKEVIQMCQYVIVAVQVLYVGGGFHNIVAKLRLLSSASIAESMVINKDIVENDVKTEACHRLKDVRLRNYYSEVNKQLVKYVVLVQKVFRGYRVRQIVKTELMSLFKHHSFEIESIESLMRRGIKIHVNVTGAQLEETGMMSECSLSLQGKSTDISLRISESLPSHDNKIHNFKEMKLRDIVAINFSTPQLSSHSKAIGTTYYPSNDSSVCTFIIFYYNSLSGSNYIIVRCNTEYMCKDLVHSLRLLIERDLSPDDLKSRGRKSWLLLPLRAIYQPKVTKDECLKALKTLHTCSAAACNVSCHMQQLPHADTKRQTSILLSCFDGDHGFKNAKGILPRIIERKGRVLVQQNFDIISTTSTWCSSPWSVALVIETYALNMILMSRTHLPLQDIIEIREVSNSCNYSQRPKGINQEKVVAIITRNFIVELKFDSHKSVFVECCRKIGRYCQQSKHN